MAVRVSNFKGQSDIVNVRRSAYAGFHLMMVMVIVLSGIVFLFRNHLGGWFTDSPEVSANGCYPDYSDAGLSVWRRVAD